MRHWSLWLSVVMLCLPCRVGAAPLDEPRLTATSGIVMDARTGAILYERHPDLPLPPASTTKVMTAVLALESGRLSESVTTSDEAARVVPSKINLRPGQRLVLEDLVYAILLNSANDASIALAEHLSGSVPAFGQRMTSRARQLGATQSRFVNPHGLTEESHHSSARDLARIFQHALSVPRFREIIGTKAIMVRAQGSTRQIALRSHNRLLENYRMPVIGKTGYTKAAKKCFVGAGSYDGREIIVALLGSRDLWGDTKRLLEFGFADVLPPEPTQLRAKRSAATERVATSATRLGRSSSVEDRKATRRGPVYSIHVGTFDRRDRAERLQRALGKRGYQAAIQRVATGRGARRRARYQVSVGSFASRGQAESVVRNMESQVDLDTRIVQR